MNPKSRIVNESEFKRFNRVFILPNIKTIFKTKRNPFDSDPRVAHWVNHVFDYSLMDEKRYKNVKVITMFVSYFYPFCKDIHHFENLVKLFLLFFVLDDHTECGWGDVARHVQKSRQIWEQSIAALHKIMNKDQFISMNGWKPYNALWFAVLQDICQDLTDVSKKRLLKTLRDYCIGNMQESDNIDIKYKFKNLEEHMKIRRNSVANYCVFSLVEYSNSISLTDEEWNDPLLQKLMLVANDAVIYNNDVASFEKEWVEQNKKLESMFNVVATIAIIERISVEAALVRIANLTLDYELKVKDLMDEILKRDLSENMRIFIDAIDYIVGGNSKVGTLIDRYNKIYE